MLFSNFILTMCKILIYLFYNVWSLVSLFLTYMFKRHFSKCNSVEKSMPKAIKTNLKLVMISYYIFIHVPVPLFSFSGKVAFFVYRTNVSEALLRDLLSRGPYCICKVPFGFVQKISVLLQLKVSTFQNDI